MAQVWIIETGGYLVPLPDGRSPRFSSREEAVAAALQFNRTRAKGYKRLDSDYYRAVPYEQNPRNNNLAAVIFKTKPFKVSSDGGPDRMAFRWKAKVGRGDTNMTPSDHPYFNSDLFEGILNRAYRSVLPKYADWAYVDEVPTGVTVSPGFMATVTVPLPQWFIEGKHSPPAPAPAQNTRQNTRIPRDGRGQVDTNWYVRQEHGVGQVTGTDLHTYASEQEARRAARSIRAEGYNTAVFYGGNMVDWQPGEAQTGPAYSKGRALANPLSADGIYQTSLYSGKRKISLAIRSQSEAGYDWQDYYHPYADETAKNSNLYIVRAKVASSVTSATSMAYTPASVLVLTSQPVNMRAAKQIMWAQRTSFPVSPGSQKNPASAANPMSTVFLPETNTGRRIDAHVPVTAGGTWVLNSVEDNELDMWLGNFASKQDALDYAQNVLSHRDSHHSHPEGLVLSSEASVRNGQGYPVMRIYNTRWREA